MFRKSKSTSSDPTPTRQSQLHDLRVQVLRSLDVTDDEIQTILSFDDQSKGERLKTARQIILDTVIDGVTQSNALFTLAMKQSESLLPGYATLDQEHRTDIEKVIERMTGYLRDTTRKRPFNVLMSAAPGAGKSHFIKQLAASMKQDRVEAVTFNMATMQTAEDIAQPLDELRNLKVNDKFPLLFLDEFDSDPSRYPALLPLLWDGELHIGNRDLQLGKAVIVLAGSNSELPKLMDQSAEMRPEPEAGDGAGHPQKKLIDLLSRINGGVIEIPGLDLRSETRDRRVDKVCMSVALARMRFGDDLVSIPRRLLRFIARTHFRFGVRSIAHLIDLIDVNAFADQTLSVDGLGLPLTNQEVLLDSSLRLHLLDENAAFGITKRWNDLSEDDAYIRLRDDLLPYLEDPSAR